MTSFSTTSLYALSVQPPSATQDSVVGDFLGNGRQQILCASGTRLSILEVSRRQRGFNEVFSQDVFGIIRNIAKFRLAGGTKGEFLLHTRKAHLVIFEGTAPAKGPLYERGGRFGNA